jgi:serine/threonine protein kinase
MLAALQRDFARLRTLEHPHIARLVELGCNGQQYYVTGERLDGEPLREVLNHLLPERLDVGEADDIVRAVGSALVYAHEQGVAHGAVRAENVLITMDRRVVLTNFLARRVAKVAARPPRPLDDLKGLARLAAELYVGSASTDALRAAVHSEVPAKRLNAIRAVLDAAKRASSVADFLETAGLASDGAGVTTRRAEKPSRSWSIWRLVFPMAAVAAIATLVASYHGGVGASAEELKARGLDALRTVAARVAPPAREPAQRRASAELLSPAAVEDPAPAPPEPTPEPPAAEAPPPASTQPAGAKSPALPSATGATTAAVSRPRAESRARAAPAVLSLGTPRIAAREDHSVVAIDIIRSGDTRSETAVGWWTAPDTAHEEDDYAGIGRQTVTFPAGATVERLLIPIVNDGVRESDEVFTVHLSRPRGGVTGAVTATRVTLHDDD